MVACKGSLALHSFRVSVIHSLYIYIHAHTHTRTEKRLPSTLHMRECAESLFSSKCYGCVFCVCKNTKWKLKQCWSDLKPQILIYLHWRVRKKSLAHTLPFQGRGPEKIPCAQWFRKIPNQRPEWSSSRTCSVPLKKNGFSLLVTKHYALHNFL